MDNYEPINLILLNFFIRNIYFPNLYLVRDAIKVAIVLNNYRSVTHYGVDFDRIYLFLAHAFNWF